MISREETFALIIGGGPVGLSLALDLGRRNVPTILVNQGTVTAQHPKCNYSNTRTMEHFRRLGIASEVRRSGLGADFPRAVSFRNRFTEYELGRIELTFLKESVWPGPEYPHNISQLFLEPILKAHAETQDGIDIRFGHKALEITMDEDGATVLVEELKSGARYVVRAAYVIGCDGASSLVRQTIGSKLVGENGSIVRNFVSGTMMAYFIRSPTLYGKSRATPAVLTWIVNHDARGFIMSQDGREKFIVHYQVPPGVDWQNLKTEDVMARMLGPTADYEVLSSGPWRGGLALVADKYSDGRAFIAGDAAHLYTPLGGFGMNTGIGDAINLGWKLAAMHQGWGGRHLTESYDPERRPIGTRNSQIGIHCAARKDKWHIPADINEDSPTAEKSRASFGAFIAEDDRDEYATLGIQLGERYFSPVVVPPTESPAVDSWDRYTPSDAAGARAPHFLLDEQTSVYDAFGFDFALIAFAGADSEPIEREAASCKLPIRTVRSAKLDPQYKHLLVLVRPDGHVAWSGDRAPADARALIDRIRGAIS
ncbi:MULTISPECIES: FAD-dependent monooxygenase [unclassified Bradyrhizobium]|uniref:FAD-dependent monooxygenase n=1 Tax=unclassified Bradyrhizobium TaxID=2631580 RepID=UPI003396FFC4